jgi:RHS repeat-associated protein
MQVARLNYFKTHDRYFYQGSEMDKEVKGDGNSYTTTFRQLDPRLGRWMSLDPKVTAWESPYVSMGNNPITQNDILGDTVRQTDSFKKDKHLQKSYNKWAKTEMGKNFLKDYGIGGKFEHVSIVFDNTLNSNSFASGTTGAYSVNNKTHEPTPLDGDSKAPGSYLAKSGNKDNYLRFVLNFKKNSSLLEYSELEEVSMGAIILHETQHVEIGHKAILNNKKIPTSREQHGIMRNSEQKYYWDRVSFWWVYTSVWYADYLEKKKLNKNIKSGIDYINIIQGEKN